ncbi:Rha family transcriptional regulator [Halomonas janggokensis]|uniref:Rha family transcriptional regulator n=1 Tax=Vreelandella janggokensis TaxID=370767 RepID=A0ABT4IRQ4_9GAMM|nr:BRO family protein [Halomonas janggokensis]MCZ0926346.1 Rha family transcriptional regulator [Halomonas janggokensis]MCZ0928884.1 Rha family transcriptional regulator [Halomonas janggokensis]
MTTEIRTFNTSNHIAGLDLNIRVVDQDGEPWFVSMDVRSVLGLNGANSGSPLQSLDSDEKQIVEKKSDLAASLPDLFPGRTARIALISESGLYNLIMRSDKPQAKPFKDWVTKIVLPAIRKDGMYVAGENNNANELFMSSRESLARTLSEIADVVESRHVDVKRTIYRLMTNEVIRGYAPMAYTHPQNGRQYNEFRVNQRDSYVIVAQLSPEFTARLVDRWQELEKQVAQPQVPQSFAQASRLAADTLSSLLSRGLIQ